MLTAVHHSVTEKQNEFQCLAFGHIDALYSTALRMTRNELDAEDLTQDVYVRAYRFFHRFEKDTNFKAWIFKILTNTYINEYRKKQKQPLHVRLEKVEHSYDNQRKDTRDYVFESLDELDYESLFDDEIKLALEQLPDEFRIVILLADINSFSYKEIAKVIGCPIGTVMSRLSRGRRQLQTHLKEYALQEGFIKET